MITPKLEGGEGNQGECDREREAMLPERPLLQIKTGLEQE